MQSELLLQTQPNPPSLGLACDTKSVLNFRMEPDISEEKQEQIKCRTQYFQSTILHMVVLPFRLCYSIPCYTV